MNILKDPEALRIVSPLRVQSVPKRSYSEQDDVQSSLASVRYSNTNFQSVFGVVIPNRRTSFNKVDVVNLGSDPEGLFRSQREYNVYVNPSLVVTSRRNYLSPV